MANTEPTGNQWVDLDHHDMPDSELDASSMGRKDKRQFLTNVGGQERDREEMKVRLNGKSNPPATKTFKKSTLVKYENANDWVTLGDGVPANNAIDVYVEKPDERGRVVKMMIFMQELKTTKTGVAYVALEKVYRHHEPEAMKRGEQRY